jgi:hypothetical protein
MSLNYEFKNAARTIARLSPEDHHALALICKDIQQAENDLNKKASVLLSRCITSCTGICCRNIRLFEIPILMPFREMRSKATSIFDVGSWTLNVERSFFP